MSAIELPGADTDEVLTVQDLSVSFAQSGTARQAVRDLALSIRRGRTFALVGESGCGKSTAALALMRLLPPAARLDAGQVWLGRIELNELPESEMRMVRGGRIGMIFQEPSACLDPVMTVGEQLMETLRAHTGHRGRALRERAVQWLTRVGIDDAARRLNDYPFQFSGGQKQRIMIAIALAAEPRLLIADEPTTALDVQTQAQILDLLMQLQREMGLAILLITHDLPVVRQVADHVALMHAGEIVETADVLTFFNRPKHPYARALLAAVPSLARRGASLLRRYEDDALPSSPASEASAALAIDKVESDPPPEEGPPPVWLSVRDLSVSYESRGGWRRAPMPPVVRGVGFTLRRGETLALLGASGSGKTTLARALLGLLDSRARVQGQCELDGEPVLLQGRNRPLAWRQSVQMVFQDPYASLDPRMLVGDILAEGVAALRPEVTAAARSEQVVSWLERVGLEADAAQRYPHEFSGGQRQRIAIARALAVSPRVLICDEPTSALDVSVQAQILTLLQQLQQALGTACLFITHNIGVAEFLAHRVAVLHQGEVVEAGDAETVLSAPTHPETQRLLDAVPRL